MNETDLAWAAGFIDGEGTISAQQVNGGRSYTLKLSAVNTDKRPIEKLAFLFGGQPVSTHRDNRPTNRDCYYWGIYGEAAKEVLAALLPYLVLKARHAATALVFPVNARQRIGEPRHPLAAILQEECAKSLRSLNARGRVNATA